MIPGPISAGADGHPYVGLRAFRSSEQDLFYGRDHESSDIAAIWGANKLTVLYGASGVGKTSLLQAGVIPSLDSSRFDICPIGKIRNQFAGALAAAGDNPYSLSLLASWSPGKSPQDLTGATLTEFFSERGQLEDRYGDPIPIMAVIDQTEELFSDLPLRKDYLESFIDELSAALREHDGLRILMSLREDYLAAMLPYERILGGQSRMRFRLLPFGPRAALEAIRGPLAGTARSFEPGAAEQLVTDLRTITVTNALGQESTIVVDTVEPTQIQVVCSALWESLDDTTSVITSAHVQEIADVDRFLAAFCGRILSDVADKYGIVAGRIRQWLQQTFITEHGTRGTAYEGLKDTNGMSNDVVRALEDLRILRAEHRSGIRWYELAHDRLIAPINQIDPQEHLTDGRQALRDGNFELARRYATTAIRMLGTGELRLRGEAECLLGDVAAGSDHADEAQQRYRRAAGYFEVLQDSVAVGGVLAASGRLALARRHYPDAVIDLQAAIARTPEDLDTQVDLAWAIWFSGQPQVSLTMLTAVLGVSSAAVAAAAARGQILADAGDGRQALRDLGEDSLTQDAGSAAAKALALALTGQLEAATTEMSRARPLSRDNGPALLRLARVMDLTENLDAAGELATAAVAASGPPLPPHLRGEARRLASPPGGALRLPS